MQIPPPVSGASYPTSVGLETRSNYLRGGLRFRISHNSGVIVGGDAAPISDTIYSIWPTISLDKSTPRQDVSITYVPGFTFYQNVSVLNTATQSASITFKYRWTEHTSINVADSFQKTSNVFDQLYPPSGDRISASVQSPPTQITASYTQLLRNEINLGFTHQISKNSMFGASVSPTDSHYPNQDQDSVFYNSTSRGGTVFYSRRLSGGAYVGTIYQYVRSHASSANQSANAAMQSHVQTHTIAAFYTIYLSRTVSVSVSGGPQYYDATRPPLPPSRSWAPFVVAGIGWQKSHTNFSASYSRTVTGTTGLPGAFDSSQWNSSWNWQMSRTWGMELGGVYFIEKDLTPFAGSSDLGGHTISGKVSVGHSMGEHLNAEIGYAHVHQSYSIQVMAVAPDSDRTYIAVSYQLSRSLGR